MGCAASVTPPAPSYLFGGAGGEKNRRGRSGTALTNEQFRLACADTDSSITLMLKRSNGSIIRVYCVGSCMDGPAGDKRLWCTLHSSHSVEQDVVQEHFLFTCIPFTSFKMALKYLFYTTHVTIIKKYSINIYLHHSPTTTRSSGCFHSGGNILYILYSSVDVTT